MVETTRISPSDELVRSHATISETAALLHLADEMEDPLISTK